MRLLPNAIALNIRPDALALPKLTFGQSAKSRAVIEADRKRRAASRRRKG